MDNKRIYTTADTVFAWICLLFGYLFMRTLPVFKNTLGAFILVLTVFISTFVLLKFKGVKIPAISIAFGVSALILSAALITSGNSFLIFITYAYSIVCYCYFIYSALGNSVVSGVSDFIVVDFFKAVLIAPFYSIVEIFVAIAQRKSKNLLNYIIKIVCGIAIATVPTLIILLLLSYDSGFTNILSNIFSFDAYTIFTHIVSIIFAFPVGMYVFGLYTSSTHKVMDDTVTADDYKKVLAEVRIMPKLTALTATVPILFLYVVYFISQWKYYVSGFTGQLPDNFSYAEYAREGFFQLCAVSVINLIIILAIVVFMRRKADTPCILLRILTVIYCIFTLILISTAISKLIMYIGSYGLTQKRIYAMWLMVVIALVYIIIAIGQFTSRIKPVFSSLAVCIILFGALALSNVDAIIAEYNVDRYIEGTLDTVDIYAMSELGDSAVPSLVRLSEDLEEKKASGKVYGKILYDDLKVYLEAKAYQIKTEEDSVFSFNIPSHKAEKAMERLGLTE